MAIDWDKPLRRRMVSGETNAIVYRKQQEDGEHYVVEDTPKGPLLCWHCDAEGAIPGGFGVIENIPETVTLDECWLVRSDHPSGSYTNFAVMVEPEGVNERREEYRRKGIAASIVRIPAVEVERGKVHEA